MIKNIMKSIREYKKASILSIVFVSLEVVVECFIPLLMSYLIDGINNENLKLVLIYASVLIVLAFLALLFGILAGKECAFASAGFAKNLTTDMYAKISQYSFKNIDDFSTPSLVTRMTTDVSNVQMAYMMIIRTAVRAPFMLVFSTVMAFIMSPSLAWIFAITVPILLFGLGFVIFKSMPKFRKVFKQYDAVNESVQENISGIRTVKSYVREDYEKQKFGKAVNQLQNNFIKAERIVAFNQPLSQFAIFLLNVIVIFVGALLIVKTSTVDVDGVTILWGKMSVGELSSLLTYGLQSLMSLTMFSMVFVMVTLAIESGRRINEVLVTESDIQNPENPIYSVENGDIKFNNVSFKYSLTAEKMALKNINLDIKSGQTIGILGGTGSSKSTLINLIPRLYDATEGQVLVGGKDVREYDLQTLRNQVAVVLQKNLLFSGTIKENLLWGNENATDEEIIYACKQACALEFIEGFTNKFDTYIEQGGSNVSGGQKQRLCIARALLKKPKILILDDSTSAVDMKTDAIIRNELKKAIPETTKIIIAQRVSSVMDCDQIIILDKGEINAVGTHEELLKSNEIYQEIYNFQNKLNGGAKNE